MTTDTRADIRDAARLLLLDGSNLISAGIMDDTVGILMSIRAIDDAIRGLDPDDLRNVLKTLIINRRDTDFDRQISATGVVGEVPELGCLRREVRDAHRMLD